MIEFLVRANNRIEMLILILLVSLGLYRVVAQGQGCSHSPNQSESCVESLITKIDRDGNYEGLFKNREALRPLIKTLLIIVTPIESFTEIPN